MRKKTLSALLALVLALAPFSALADGANTGTGSDTSTDQPETQVIVVRGDGVEDDTPNAEYGKAYERAGLTLSEQPADGAYTLTIDEAKLQAVVKAGESDGTYQILRCSGHCESLCSV